MKILFLVAIMLSISHVQIAQETKQQSIAETGTLIIMAQEFKSIEGQLMVAAFNNADWFPTSDPYKGSISAISANQELIKFENLPHGDYAIAVIHDMNKDGKPDKNTFGIPTEGYGFSNNAMDKYGPP